ncbi:MAG: EAL domain-containing protein [Magnetococcales bacterium]|nr:EAL domain-containing protein [Magnetococcales bacterium]
MQRTILLVDDEEEILLSLSRLLRREKYNIITATSAADALEKMAENDVQVVVSDQRMPAMTGVQLLIQLKEKYPYAIRIILSGYSDFNAVSEAINSGAVYKFLSKPWDDNVLRAQIQEAFRYQLLFRRKDHLSMAFENTIEGLIITDSEGTIESVNSAFTKITGYKTEEVVGQKSSLLRSNRHSPEFYDEISDSLEKNGQWDGEIWSKRKDGELFPEWRSISAIREVDGKTSHYVSFLVEISNQKEKERQIQYQALHDPLTELPNRKLFLDRLHIAIEQAKRSNYCMAVMFIDLDRFKQINDSLGHDVGDELLKQVANRLAKSVRGEDTISRIGGDEFMLLLARLPGPKAAQSIVKKIKAVFQEVITIGAHELHATLSIGVSIFPKDGSTPEELIKNADTAMYQAKADGRNDYCFYSPDMNQDLTEKLLMKNALYKAMKNEAFLLNYQPQVDLVTGRLMGLEALARWPRPEVGNVPPSRFIPLAEEEGLILEFGKWVLKTACQQIREWQDMGLPKVRVAVNLSARQFEEDDLVDYIMATLKENNLNPGVLEVEVTESLIMRNPAKSASILAKLRGEGIAIALDDFGTGYSSLSYLREFSFDTLKLDRSFIIHMTDNPEDAAIVDTVIQMGMALKQTVLAEGAEEENQITALQAKGCGQVQGYWVSPPLNANDAAAFMKSWEPSTVTNLWSKVEKNS